MKNEGYVDIREGWTDLREAWGGLKWIPTIIEGSGLR
jgi:hypothetical protein